MLRSLIRGWGALALVLGSAAFAGPGAAAPAADSAEIAATIRADVAAVVAGINAHDVARTTAFDAPDIIFIEDGSPNSVGIASDREGFSSAFAADPNWRVSLIDETVDVASAGDMAVYRGTYNEDNTRSGVATTHRTNYLAGFRRQADGSWRIEWSVVSPMERSHKK